MTGDDERELLSLLETSVRSVLTQRHDRRRLRGPGEAGALWPCLAELGVLAASLPEGVGGAGLGPGGVALLARSFGEHLLPEPYVACAAIVSEIVARLPPGPIRAELADAIGSGAEGLSLAWRERQRQTSPFPAATRLDDDGRLSGIKRFVVSPQRRAFVTAQAGAEPVIAMVDLQGPGVAVTSCATADGSAYAEIAFEGAPIVSRLLAGDAARCAAAAAINVGLLGAAAQLTGLVAAVLQLTLEHLRTRVQFDRRIGSFQALQHRAVDIRIQLALSEASVREATKLLKDDAASKAGGAAASAAYARAGATALSACKEAIQMHGAIGFTEEADVGLFARAALQWSSWLGGAREHRARFVDHGGEMIHGA